jgi:hypothetical protein
MKETWESVNAVVALLQNDGDQHAWSIGDSFRDGGHESFPPKYLQPGPDIDIAAGNGVGSEEHVATVTTCTNDLDRVATTMGSAGVKAHTTALATIDRVGWPCCLVPTAFKVLRDLSEGEGKKGKGEKNRCAEHDCE